MYKGTKTTYMSDHILLLNFTDVDNFDETEDSTAMLNWHLAYLYQQMPYIEISARSISLSLTDHLSGMEQYDQLKALLETKPNLVIPSLYTNYRILKNPITSQIKPFFSYAPSFAKLMAYPYINIFAFITNNTNDIIHFQKQIPELSPENLRATNGKIIVIEDENIDGSMFDIFVSSYFYNDHVQEIDDDKITDYMHDRLYLFDNVYYRVNELMMKNRIHYFSHTFQNQIEKTADIKKGNDIVSMDVNCDLINRSEEEDESPAEMAELYLSSVVNIINDVLQGFNQKENIAVVIEHPMIDKETDHFTINIILRAKKDQTVLTKEFDEMFFIIKSMFDYTAQMYVQYKEWYEDRHIMPTGLKYKPLF